MDRDKQTNEYHEIFLVISRLEKVKNRMLTMDDINAEKDQRDLIRSVYKKLLADYNYGSLLN